MLWTLISAPVNTPFAKRRLTASSTRFLRCVRTLPNLLLQRPSMCADWFLMAPTTQDTSPRNERRLDKLIPPSSAAIFGTVYTPAPFWPYCNVFFFLSNSWTKICYRDIGVTTAPKPKKMRCSFLIRSILARECNAAAAQLVWLRFVSLTAPCRIMPSITILSV